MALLRPIIKNACRMSERNFNEPATATTTSDTVSSSTSSNKRNTRKYKLKKIKKNGKSK